MGVQLFRAGDTHDVNGIKCEKRTFNEYSYLHELENDWFYSPEECYDNEENVEGESDDEKVIRAAAKESGIKHWWNKSIAKLEEELTSVGDQD